MEETSNLLHKVAALEAELVHEKQQRAHAESAIRYLAQSFVSEKTAIRVCTAEEYFQLKGEVASLQHQLGSALKAAIAVSQSDIKAQPARIADDLLDFCDAFQQSGLDKLKVLGDKPPIFDRSRCGRRPKQKAAHVTRSTTLQRSGSKPDASEAMFKTHQAMLGAACFTEDLTEQEQEQVWTGYVKRFKSLDMSSSQFRDYYKDVVRVEYLQKRSSSKDLSAHKTNTSEVLSNIIPTSETYQDTAAKPILINVAEGEIDLELDDIVLNPIHGTPTGPDNITATPESHQYTATKPVLADVADGEIDLKLDGIVLNPTYSSSTRLNNIPAAPTSHQDTATKPILDNVVEGEIDLELEDIVLNPTDSIHITGIPAKEEDVESNSQEQAPTVSALQTKDNGITTDHCDAKEPRKSKCQQESTPFFNPHGTSIEYAASSTVSLKPTKFDGPIGLSQLHVTQNAGMRWQPDQMRSVLITYVPREASLADVLDHIKSDDIVVAIYNYSNPMLTRPPLDTNSIMLTFVTQPQATAFFDACRLSPLRIDLTLGGKATLHVYRIEVSSRPIPTELFKAIAEEQASRKLLVTGRSESQSGDDLSIKLASTRGLICKVLRAVDVSQDTIRLEFASIEVAFNARNKLKDQYRILSSYFHEPEEFSSTAQAAELSPNSS